MKRRILVISLIVCLAVCVFSKIAISAEDWSKEHIYNKFCFDYGSGHGKAYPDDEEKLEKEIDRMQKNSGVFRDFGSPNIELHFGSGMSSTHYDTAFENSKDVVEKVPYESHLYVDWVKEPYVSIKIAYQDVTKELLTLLAESNWINEVVVKYPEMVLPEDPPAETGDGAVYGVTVLGVAAAALTVLLLRKKKI